MLFGPSHTSACNSKRPEAPDSRSRKARPSASASVHITAGQVSGLKALKSVWFVLGLVQTLSSDFQALHLLSSHWSFCQICRQASGHQLAPGSPVCSSTWRCMCVCEWSRHPPHSPGSCPQGFPAQFYSRTSFALYQCPRLISKSSNLRLEGTLGLDTAQLREGALSTMYVWASLQLATPTCYHINSSCSLQPFSCGLRH